MAGGESLPDRIARMRETARELAERIEAGGTAAIVTSDRLTPDHPYSRLFGFERAKLLLNPELAPHRVKAAERRAIVQKMSLARRPVREIADAAGLTYYSTVKVRARLRGEGQLPPL